jgi:hypothetical protein
MANRVVDNENTPENIRTEARLIRGKIYLSQENWESAKGDFAWLAENSKTKEGAEGKYRMAEIAYRQNDLDAAEKGVFELVQGFASFDYWKIKGFLLLADVYAAREDYFQAKATLKSVIDNVQDEALVAQAREKMAQIEAAELRGIEEKKAKSDAEQKGEPDEYDKLMDDTKSPGK